MAKTSKDTAKVKRETRKRKTKDEVNLTNVIEVIGEEPVEPIALTNEIVNDAIDQILNEELNGSETPNNGTLEGEIISEIEKIPSESRALSADQVIKCNNLIMEIMKNGRSFESEFSKDDIRPAAPIEDVQKRKRNNQRYTFGYTWNGQVMG